MMESYGDIGMSLSFAGIFISIISGIIYVLCKRTLKYAWLFGCIAGFCFFTTFRHIIVLLAYDDVSDPNYGTYMNWDIFRFIRSDITRLFIWLGIGILNYYAFIKRNKLLKYLLISGWILGISIFLIMMVLCSAAAIW